MESIQYNVPFQNRRLCQTLNARENISNDYQNVENYLKAVQDKTVVQHCTLFLGKIGDGDVIMINQCQLSSGMASGNP
jgi:hypothetical protein